MNKIIGSGALVLLGACVYGNPVNHEKFYSTADITKVDWARVDGKGSSCQTNWFFGLIPLGSNSLASAVERAELSKVAYVDTDTVLYLPLLMTRECTNVYGELTPAARSALMYKYSDENSTGRTIGSPAPNAMTARAPARAESVIPTAPAASKSDYDFLPPEGN